MSERIFTIIIALFVIVFVISATMMNHTRGIPAERYCEKVYGESFYARGVWSDNPVCCTLVEKINYRTKRIHTVEECE